MSKKAPDGILFRCRNKYGDSKTGLPPCEMHGAKGHPGNLVRIPANQLPPAGMVPRCPNPKCDQPLDPADPSALKGQGTKTRKSPVGLILAAFILCLLGGGLVWWLIPSGGQPKAVLTPLDASWGKVPVGDTRSLEVTIANQGKAELVILSGEMTGPGFGIQQAVERVPAGESRIVILTFAPVQPGPANGSLVLTTNEPNNGKLTLSLSGTTGTSKPEEEGLRALVRKVFEPIDSRIAQQN